MESCMESKKGLSFQESKKGLSFYPLKAKWGTGASFIAPDVDYGFPAAGLGQGLSTVASAGRRI